MKPTILIPRFSWKDHRNALWTSLKSTLLGPTIQHEGQLITAARFRRNLLPFPNGLSHAAMLCRGLFAQPLRGAAYGWESKYPLPFDPTATIPVVTSGANSADMHVFDFVRVMSIGIGWVVAGTATALIADFDHFTGMADGTGTETDKLDETNGTITAPTVAGQAIGNILYKDLADTLTVDLDPGSVRFIVTTTTSAGSGVPFCLVIPRSEEEANLARYIASS